MYSRLAGSRLGRRGVSRHACDINTPFTTEGTERMEDIPLHPPWEVNAQLGRYMPANGPAAAGNAGPERADYSVQVDTSRTAEQYTGRPPAGPAEGQRADLRFKFAVFIAILLTFLACSMTAGVALSALQINWLCQELPAMFERASYVQTDVFYTGGTQLAAQGLANGLAADGSDSGFSSYNVTRLNQTLIALLSLLQEYEKRLGYEWV